MLRPAISVRGFMLKALMCLGVSLCAAGLFAQDQNYWFHQFGTKSHFLGGAVVAGADDTTATFYNPARLGFIEDPQLSVSATAYQFDRYFVRDGAGKDRDLIGTNWRVVPSIVSGVHIFDFAPDHVFAHSIVARHSYSNSLNTRREASENVIDDARHAGNEDYTAQITLDASLSEYWAGISWGWCINDYLSVGVTPYGALRVEKTFVDVSARAVWFNGTVFEAASIRSQSYLNYTDVRGFIKAGMALDLGYFKAGATVTTAAVHLWGQGTVARDTEIVNIDADMDGTGDSVVLNDRQEGRPTEFRSPWSFALGFELTVSPTKTRLAVSAEWFLPVGDYTVIQPESGAFFQGLGNVLGGSRDFLRVRDTHDSVLNIAAGVSQPFGNWLIGEWTGHWGFYTDFTSNVVKKNDNIHLGTTEWDLYHGITGVTVRSKHSELGIGVHFVIGSDSIDKNINLDGPTEANLLLGVSQGARGVYWAIGVVVGYTYFL